MEGTSAVAYMNVWCTHVCMYVLHVCVHVCVQACMCTLQACVHVRVYVCVCVCVCVCVQACMCTLQACVRLYVCLWSDSIPVEVVNASPHGWCWSRLEVPGVTQALMGHNSLEETLGNRKIK